MATIPLNLYLKRRLDAISIGKRFQYFFWIANTDLNNGNQDYGGSGIYDATSTQISSDPSTFFVDLPTAEASLISRAYTALLADLNNGFNSDTYVQGNIVTFDKQLSDALSGVASETLTTTVTSGIATFTFAKTYTTAPKVVAQIIGGADTTHGALCYISSVSTTGATVYAMKNVTTTLLVLGAVDPDAAVANGTVVELIVYA